MVTSASVTATAFTTRGNIIATPAPSSTPNCRRVTCPAASYFFTSSSKWSWSHMAEGLLRASLYTDGSPGGTRAARAAGCSWAYHAAHDLTPRPPGCAQVGWCIVGVGDGGIDRACRRGR